MALQTDLLSSEWVDSLLALPEVVAAKERLENRSGSNGHEMFFIPLSSDLKQHLEEGLGIDLSSSSSIPMRWVKGDTKAHTDRGAGSFSTTHLVYLTDSSGELVVDGSGYPIRKGYGYSFSEGLSHETVGTGHEPRLLLGPMSETGFSVGASGIYAPGGTTAFVRQTAVGNPLEYSTDQVDWYTVYWYCFVYNTDTSLGFLTIEFITDITLDSTVGGSYGYFVCASDKIQIGSRSLKVDGTRPVITVDGITDYPGFIQNGSSSGNGYNDIYVCNLEIRVIGGSTLLSDGGWMGHAYFGHQALRNAIVYCSSDGPIIDGGGGIVGGYAGQGDQVNVDSSYLSIIGCSSQGNTGTYSGGIVGFYAGRKGGKVICQQCWSTGSIGVSAGGIVGYEAANGDGGISGYVGVIRCYSTGEIGGTNAGGIVGQLAGTSATVEVEACYSQGACSGTNAGGIYGSGAASDGGTTLANNCYSSGALSGGATDGIYGGGSGGSRTVVNCYAANGGWSDVTANSNLVGTPPSGIVGTTWVASAGSGYPYELNGMGYTPYTVQNIVLEGVGGLPILKGSSSQTLSAGQGSVSAIRAGLSYTKMTVSGGSPSSYGTITIDASTGIISTTSSTLPGVYTLTIRNTGSYNLTLFELTVLGLTDSVSGSIAPCCEANVPRPNPQVSDYDSNRAVTKPSSRAMVSNVDTFYRGVSTGQRTAHSQPVFKSYHDYILFLQGKLR